MEILQLRLSKSLAKYGTTLMSCPMAKSPRQSIRQFVVGQHPATRSGELSKIKFKFMHICQKVFSFFASVAPEVRARYNLDKSLRRKDEEEET